MRFYEELHMGEGVSGSVDVGASTSALYSCIGIAFVNRQSGLGGLYHYPARTLQYPDVRETIRQMINNIQPDEIVLTPASRAVGMGMGAGQDDIDLLAGVLGELSPGTVVRIALEGVAAQLFWANGNPVFNRLPDGVEPSDEMVEPEMVQSDLRQNMHPFPRPLGGGDMYYGGDGETSGVLEEAPTPAADTPSRPSRGRRVLTRIQNRTRSIRDKCIHM